MKKSLIVLILTSTFAFSANIEIREGWNLVGFPVLAPTPISEILPTDKVSKIYAYNGFWNDTITQIEPYKGYWINAKDSFEIEDLSQKMIDYISKSTGKSTLIESKPISDSWDF